MNDQEKNNLDLKLFISYSHKDEKYVEEFKKRMSPLIENGLIREWYDRKIVPGKEWEKEIENNLSDADVICFFISANFLSSKYCRKEKEYAYNLKKKKNIVLVPIILSPCAWEEDEKLSDLLALPIDGKPLSEFPNRDRGWLEVVNGLKSIIQDLIYLRKLTLKEEFTEFLRSTDLLMKAHPKKEDIFLEDIFVPPVFNVYDELREYERKIDFEEFLDIVMNSRKIVVSGESQSGKTTFCKVLFSKFRNRGFVPIYIRDQNRLRGSIDNIISRYFAKEYDGDIANIDNSYIIPIIDDFYLAKDKDRVLTKLIEKYSKIILVVDDVFSLNLKDSSLLSEFRYFEITEFKASQRYELIKKWVELNFEDKKDIQLYREIDKRIEQIEYTLGKIFGRGVMPSFPFFILSAVVTYETFAIPLNQEITSQGYCYQAFVYFYLRKRGVKNNEIDIYVNFLTELSYYIFKKKKNELTTIELHKFIEYYSEKFTLPLEVETILKKIDYIYSGNNFGNFSYTYSYLYYFFVAKYLAENIEKEEIWHDICEIIDNLHIEENAYISVFIVHHSKDQRIIDKIKSNALELFNRYQPASLTRDDTKFFDEHMEEIIEASLPPANTTPEKERKELLKVKDKIEDNKEEIEKMLNKDLRKAIKNGEVIGCILKNRVGSLEKKELVDLLVTGINIHLRVLSFFFNIIKNEETQRYVTTYISQRLQKIVEEKEKEEVSLEELRKIAETIFWNLNFLVVFGLIKKTVLSIGSDKLIEIIDIANNKINTPSFFLVKHGIYMWYLKNPHIDMIAKQIKDRKFSRLAEKVAKFMIVEYAYLHPLNYRERQKIVQKLGIPTNKIPLLPRTKRR